jgi:hypothetical protein
MAEHDVEALLDSAGWGVLSLADGDEPYSIPVSFGYSDGVVYFALVRGDPPNRKFEFVTEGATARLLVTDVRARFDWQSVAVTGPLCPVQRRDDLGDGGLLPEVDDRPDPRTERGRDWQTLLDTLEDSSWFSSEFERADPVSQLQGWRLDPDEVRGVEVRPDPE